MHFRNKAPAAYPNRRPTRHDTAARVPSTAWLAAQEAFSAPPPAQAEPAVVTVRRAWNPAHNSHATAAAGPGETPSHPERPARVFLVASDNNPAPNPAPSPAAETGAAPLLAVVRRAGTDAGAPVQPTTPRPAERRAQRQRRRLHADKLPGPVRLITQPMQAQAARPQAPPAPGPSAGEQLRALKAAMAELKAVFDAIQRARALRFLD